jgi:hypothetical protein
MRLFINPLGQIQHLLDEDSPVEKVLPPPSSIGRFSNVDTMQGTTDWWIEIPNRPPIGPFPTRKEALDVEKGIAEQSLRDGSVAGV